MVLGSSEVVDLLLLLSQPALCLLTELLRGRESVCGPMPSLEVNFILFRQQLHLDEDTTQEVD